MSPDILCIWSDGISKHAYLFGPMINGMNMTPTKQSTGKRKSIARLFDNHYCKYIVALAGLLRTYSGQLVNWY